MKSYLTAIIVISACFSYSAYAKKNTWLNNLGTTISIVRDGAGIINELDTYNRRHNSNTPRIVYKDKIIYKEVVKPSEEEIKLKKRLSENTRKLAWEKAKDKKHKKAIKLYKESLEYDANNWKIWHGYAWSFSELDMFTEAENSFKAAINLGGNDDTWRYRGWNFERKGDKENAKTCYQNALIINSKNKKARYALNHLKNNAKSKLSGNWYTVSASPSLTVRSTPSVKGRNKIGSLKNNSQVKLIKFVGNTKNIGGRNGKWALVEYKNTKGYVFGAHLRK